MNPDNFTPANRMSTSHHVQPEWYFHFAYAILPSVPRKLGVATLVASILVLLLIFSYQRMVGSSRINEQNLGNLKQAMFEGLVASILNKWLGKYVKDLDTEHLNVGIFGGEARLNNLLLKAEALYELKLPIEVKYGVIGSINLIIPWSSLSSQAIVITVEDVLIVACPVGSTEYSPEKERKLLRAFKKKVLDDLDGEYFLGTGSGSLFENLLTALTNNVQVFIRKVHLRYEDEFCKGGIVCGLCIEGISMETTNSKWKPCTQSPGSSTVYQLAKLEAATVYFNAEVDKSDFLGETWRENLKEGLQTFSVRGKPFDFLIKPFNAKMKTIVSRSNDTRVPKLLVDFVIHDLVYHLSRTQLLSIIALIQLFRQINLRRNFLSYRLLCPVTGNIAKWWKYSFKAVLQQRVYPYQWRNIQRHRAHYREYKELFKKVALNPGDTELRLDLSRAEDNLELSSIVIAREHAKIEIKNEDPDRIEIISGEEKWWSFGNVNSIKFHVKTEKPRGIWSQLSQAERQKLNDIRKLDGDIPLEKAKKYIEHKLNITIHHFSGSIFVRGNEIASVALSQLLGSFETRPEAHAFKISARAESFTVEGPSNDQGLLTPFVTVAVGSGSSSNVLCVDFEKNPLTVEADYGIIVNLEQLEVIYQEHAFSEFLNFFQGIGISQKQLKMDFLLLWQKIKKFKMMVEKRQVRVDFNMSIKTPYFVIAESGSLQKTRMVTVVDLGHWTLHTDLQPPLCLDEVTQMELEERLYDRFYINLDAFQILFGDSGIKWKESLKLDDTEHHILSKARGQIVLSSSIKPDYKLLPKSKLNVTLYNMKLNISDRRIVMFLDFLENLPLPSSNTVSVIPVIVWTHFENDVIQPDASLDFQQIKNLVVSSELSRQRTPDHSNGTTPTLAASGLSGDKTWSSVEVSDEDVELWARTVDLPGFDDNISPNNIITSLLRMVVGEIVLVLSRSNDTVDRPYIMARISKCRLDAAFMIYGPAVQATLGGVQLIDKLHIGSSGEYLEIITTQSDSDFISVLYRKVRSDCPDFKSHFHCVEQSLVLDIGVLSLTIHREAILTFTKYLQYLFHKIAHKEVLSVLNLNHVKHLLKKSESRDPPIPPGAVKFSYSTHMSELRAKLCDTEFEFLEIKVKGFESDCMFKANERMVLRAYLSSISVEDLSEVTLYPKVISVEEDKVFELKYVRHSPRLYTKGLSSGQDDVHSDGSLKLNLEKIHIVLICKMGVDIQHFIEPLVPIGVIWQITRFIRKTFTSQVNQLKGWNTRLHLSLLLNLPVLLIPQKAVSPNLIVFNLGKLSVENFFKGLTGYNVKEETPHIIDNILLKLESAGLSRASMTLTENLEIQEEVLEPVHVRFDVKRFVGGTSAMFKAEDSSKCRETPLFEIFGNLEPVKISFGQKDLFTFLSVWKDNFTDRKFLEVSWWWRSTFPIDKRNVTENDELIVRKLQVFLSHSDACRKDTVARFIIDSITVDLYNDIGEILSSPVRDLNQGLSRLTLSEASFYLEKNYDSSIDMKMALQTCLLEDIRTDPSVIVKKVFQSHHGGESKFDSTISISTPPIVDVTFKQTQTGERCVDILVEKTRLNLSMSFISALVKFTMDSLPVKENEGGFINHGYEGDLGHKKCIPHGLKISRLPLNVDSTTRYHSSGMLCTADEQSGLSVSLQCRKPELVIFSTGKRKTSAILMRCEVLVDWSKHPGRDALVISLAGLQAWSKSHPDPTTVKQKTVTILYQCDVEIARNITSADDGLKVTVMISPIDIRLSVAAVTTIVEITEEFRTMTLIKEEKTQAQSGQNAQDLKDLWSPKKISSYCEADSCAAESENLLPQQPSFPVGKPAESLTINMSKIKVVLEVPQGNQRRPLFVVNASFKSSIHDWSSSLNLKGHLQIEAAYFNEDIDVWEPFIEPCVDEERVYHPWELVFQVFQGKSFPISPHINFQNEQSSNKGRKVSNHTDELEDSETSGDESDQGMTFLKRQNFDTVQEIKKQNFSLICGDSSDSENEEGALEKLTNAVGHLFTGGSSEGDLSESDTSATEGEIEEQEAITEEETASAISATQERAVFLKKHSDSVDSGLEAESVERFAVHVLIHSKDRLEMTVTPSLIKVLQEISKAFSSCPSFPIPSLNNSISIKNSLGPNTTVTLLSKTELSSYEPVLVANYDRDVSPSSSHGSGTPNLSPTSDWDTDLEDFEKAPHKSRLSPVFQYSKESLSKLYERLTENHLLIEIPGFRDLKIVAPKTTCTKVHVLQPNRHQTRYHVILNVEQQYGFKKYSIRGPLQLRNDTSYTVGLYYRKSIIEALRERLIGEATNPFEDMIRMAVIEPDDVIDVPLFVAYHCTLHIMPVHVSNYNISENGVCWQEMMADMRAVRNLCCLSKQENDESVFSVKAFCEEIPYRCKNLRTSLNCLIRLSPPLVISNLLPYAMEIKLPLINYEVRIEAGEKSSIYSLNLQKSQKIIIEIPEYLGISWAGSFNITAELEEKVMTMVTEQDTDGGNKQLALSLRINRNPTVNVQVYSPYWIINKTGLPLQIRGSLSDFIHEWTGEGPLLFCFRKQRKRYVRVRAFSSSWSSAFSLDTPGCSGLIICKDKERKRRYRILAQTSLSQMCPKLTKIISFLPNFIVTNYCKKYLRFMEDNERADLWIDIAPGQCLPFWPETDSMRMFVKFRDSKHISQHFPVTISHTTVLRMDKGCGITVVVTGSVDQPFSIRFQNYKPGDAPVRIDNQCEDLFLKFHQKELGQVALLSPYQSLLYTWDDPSKERSLFWNVYNNKGKDFCVPFWKDGFGKERVSFHVVRQDQCSSTESVTAKLSAGLKRLTPKSPLPDDNTSSSSDDSEEEAKKPQLPEKTRRDKIIVYWASYLEGNQRVLLFTQDERTAKKAKRTLDAERSHLELFVSIAGSGMSLINKDSRGNPRELSYLSLSDSAAQWEVTVAHRWKIVALELASWLEDKYREGLSKAQIKDYIHIDFEKMQMTKPFFGELRRKHRPAIWIQYRRSKHMSLFHFQLHRLQIDNQLHDAEFPTVFYPVIRPANSTKSNVRPALEIAYLKKYSQSCNDVFKFVKFVVQEHSLQLERHWMCEINLWFKSLYEERSNSAKIRHDIALVHTPLTAVSAKSSIESGNENMFEYLHCSPIKLQITYSSQSDQDPKDCFSNPFIDYFLCTLAPNFAQVKSVTIKLLCFEIIGQLCNKNFVWDQGIQYFKSQFWQQIHVLIMGINVLANPFSQFLDFSDDSHPLFYEPFLENTGVPEEFSEGISAGALGLLGHETGGPSGTTTLFAALLGTALETVIQHEDSKKKILQNEIDKFLPESIINSSFNFASVCPLALSGVVKGNVGNETLQGVEAFFKGPGKGLMGLMNKSTCGVFNCLSMITDGLKRAIEMGEGVISRTRPPRYVNPILGLRPYIGYEARGLALQNIISKGLYSNDTYWAHADLTSESKTILLITLQHVFLIGKYKSWGFYEPIWILQMDDLVCVPTMEDENLIYTFSQDKNSTSWHEGKTVFSHDRHLLQWLKNQTEAALVLSMEDKPLL